MILVIKVPGYQKYRMTDFGTSKLTWLQKDTQHEFLHVLMDDVYTEYSIDSHTTFSFSGEVCADSDYRRKSLAALAHVPPFTPRDAGVFSDFWLKFKLLKPDQISWNSLDSHKTQQPRAHYALGVGDELPTKNSIDLLQMRTFLPYQRKLPELLPRCDRSLVVYLSTFAR